MKGLLNKAEKARKIKKSSPKKGEIISNEEQQEIMKEIERISGKSRINVTPDLFKLNALKKGFLFPLFVNIMAIAILGGGIYATKYYFDVKEKESISSTAQLQSAEGNLIKEIKKDTEEKLAEKESEILDIQASLQKIEAERTSLEQNMQSKISEKGAQLQREMEEALEIERAKLLSQGISTIEVEKQIEALKLEQVSLFEEELRVYRQEAENEKITLESNLNQLHSEYNEKLVTINEERVRIEEEARNREIELTARMESRTRELESEKTVARLEIERLTEQSDRESLVENQIIGFYRNIEDLIKKGELDRASEELQNLEKYLYDDSVISLGGLSKRREIDLFVIDSLSKLIDVSNVSSQGEMDTMSLIDSAERLREIQDMVHNADQQRAVGNVELAEIMYRNALKKIPEIDKSHQYFLNIVESELELGYQQLNDVQNDLESLEDAIQEREKNVSSFLASADSSYNAGNYQDALSKYQKAYAATGFDDMEVSSRKMMESSNNLAIVPFQDKIGTMARQLSTLNELQVKIESEQLALENELGYKDLEISSYSDKLESGRAELITLNDKIDVQTKQIRSYEQRIEEMKSGLENQRERTEDENVIDKKISELVTLKTKLNQLNKSYTDFELIAENLSDNEKGDVRTVDALSDFFEEDSIDEILPGISEYLRSFSSVYINAGTEIGLYEGVSLLYEMNNLDSNPEKRAFLRNKREVYADNEAMLELISQMEKSYRGDE